MVGILEVRNEVIYGIGDGWTTVVNRVEFIEKVIAKCGRRSKSFEL